VLAVAGGILLALLILLLLPALVVGAVYLVRAIGIIIALTASFFILGPDATLIILVVGGIIWGASRFDDSSWKKSRDLEPQHAESALEARGMEGETPQGMAWQGIGLFWSLHQCLTWSSFARYIRLKFSLPLTDRKRLDRKIEMNQILDEAQRKQWDVLNQRATLRQQKLEKIKSARETKQARLDATAKKKAKTALDTVEKLLEESVRLFVDEGYISIEREESRLLVKGKDGSSFAEICADERQVIGELFCTIKSVDRGNSVVSAPMTAKRAAKKTSKMLRKLILN
jgi:hypothetical protein